VGIPFSGEVNGPARSPALPDVPTLQEAGFGNAENPTWFGLFLPAGTPQDIVNRLYRETVKALQSPKVRDKLTALGVGPMAMPPREFTAFVDKQIATDAALAKAIDLRAK
jgi:tripartite-type tricarboxylate transporter receptor subunit TctC